MKNSLQILEHFTGPQQRLGKIVFINFVPRHPFRSKCHSGHYYATSHIWKARSAPIQSKDWDSHVCSSDYKKCSKLPVKYSRKTVRIDSHVDTFDLPLPQWPLTSPPPEGIKPLNPPAFLIGAQRLSLDFLNLTYYFGIFFKRFISINQMERWTKKSWSSLPNNSTCFTYLTYRGKKREGITKDILS